MSQDTTDLGQLARDIAQQLSEQNVDLIVSLLEALGADQTNAVLAQTLEIEAGEGMQRKDNPAKRRTPGGVFFYLAKGKLTNRQRRHIWPKPKKVKEPGDASAPAKPKAPAVPSLTWNQVVQLFEEVIKSIGEARTVKLTLIGRPGRIVQQPSCAVLSMKGKEPPSLPKGLPTPPANSVLTWAVFVANKQWEKVKGVLADNTDNLIVEGYPILDPKTGAAVVLATSVKSVAQERANREKKAA